MTQQGSVWDSVAKELVMTVLAHLPEPDCLRARAVCKNWKELIDSDDFAKVCCKLWMEMKETMPSWFLLYQSVKLESAFIYDPRDDRFYKLPLTFLPVKQALCGRAAAGSLLCVEERAKGFFKALYLCDPLAKTWTKLPPMTIEESEENLDSRRSVILAVEKSELLTTYKVFVSCNNQTQVYDSVSNSWQHLGGSRVWSSAMSSVLCDNAVFTLSPHPGSEIGPENFQLLKFNLDDPRREWRPVEVQMPCCLRSPHLAVHEGRIIMVGKVYTRMPSPIGESSSARPHMVGRLKIWKLSETGASWDLVDDHVPDYMYSELINGNWNTACAWNGEWICIACRDRVLSYNLRTKTWGLSDRTSSSGPNTNGFRSSDSSDKPTLSLISTFMPTFRKGFLFSAGTSMRNQSFWVPRGVWSQG